MVFARWFRLSTLVGALVLTGLSSQVCAEGDIVAKVGGVSLTRYELDREVQKIMPFNVSFHGKVSQEKIDDIRNQALTALLERAYKVRFALAEEISVANEAVEEEMAKYRSKFESQAQFEQALGAEGLSAFRGSIYRELLAKKAEAVAVDSGVKVTDEEVRAFYDKNKSMYMRPRQFKASHILVKVDPASSKAERDVLLKKAQGLAAQAEAGEDFYNLAYYNSDDRSKYVGGDLGYFHEGQTVPEFEEALVKMKPGEIAGPIKTMFGYHIVKLVELNEPRQLNFEEVKDNLRQSLEKKQRENLYDAWMNGLKARFEVERFDK
ncbi:peptidylprolyl isomerase [Desulfuromonas soudanensis]|uniref:Peptidylprolyl isomerase n=1 Tax=Desulfuromonas soudanensis TaxID=1603606 RepID=A0A0M4CXX1_9BACT|nr:peptidylprolyl isomerase [Desulfuromonas soudanensis]ALC17178.1 peptidylprolyl isomerase [Desulfuromonas soudanensis]